MVSKELVIRYQTGESTQAESHAIDQCHSEKVENKRNFNEIEFLWKATGIAGEIDVEPKSNDWDAVLGKIEKKAESDLINSKERQPESQKISPPKSREFLNKLLKIAAIFMLAFSFFWAAIYFLNQRSQKDSLTYNQIITTKGKKSQIILSDGTKVWLNAQTVLKYPTAFNEDQREVYLEGEAFFEVQKQENKVPFLVKTNDIDIEVFGPCFNVKAYSDEETVETTLVEGSICVVRKGRKPSQEQNVLLETNQKVSLIKKGSHVILSDPELDKSSLAKSLQTTPSISPIEKEQILVSSKVEVELYTAWKDEMLVFQSKTLANITYKLERRYDAKIHIENEKLKNYRDTGIFEYKETLIQVLQIPSLTTPIKYTFKQNDLFI